MPEEDTGCRLNRWLDADGAETFRHAHGGAGETGADAFDMAAIAAVGQHGVEHGRGERTAGHGGGDPQVGQRLDPVGPRGDVPAASRGRQRLGEAADADHPVEPVEGCEAGRWHMLEVGEDIVLDDDEVVRLGDP